MKRGLKITLYGFGLILIAVMVGGGWCLSKALPIGTGFVAKYLCSSVFISKRNQEKVFREDIVPMDPLLAGIIDAKVDPVQKTVTAFSFGFFKTKAVYREHCGCTLVVGTTEEELRKQEFMNLDSTEISSEIPPDLPWPAGSRGPVDPLPEGVNAEKLERALDAAFSEPDPEKPRKTRALVVVYDGQLIAERYAPGFDRNRYAQCRDGAGSFRDLCRFILYVCNSKGLGSFWTSVPPRRDLAGGTDSA